MGVRWFTALPYAHRPGVAGWLNDWAVELSARTPGCLRSATFYPEDGVEEEVRRRLEDGTQVFKVHVQVGGFDPADPVLDPVWGLLAERHERVCLDTTMAFTDFFESEAPYPRDLLPRLRDLGLAGRVLLGSDFPNIPYPYAHQLESLAGLDLGDDWLRTVGWHSPRAVLGVR